MIFGYQLFPLAELTSNFSTVDSRREKMCVTIETGTNTQHKENECKTTDTNKVTTIDRETFTV